MQAARELSSRENRWRKARKRRGGAKNVRADLIEECFSEKFNNKKPWKSALYTCLHQNEQFCNMNWQI